MGQAPAAPVPLLLLSAGPFIVPLVLLDPVIPMTPSHLISLGLLLIQRCFLLRLLCFFLHFLAGIGGGFAHGCLLWVKTPDYAHRH
jgi:hypothetical protein